MKINLQPMLDEMRQTRGNPTMNHPELVKIYNSYSYGDAQTAISKHWQDVDQGLTSEYEQLKEKDSLDCSYNCEECKNLPETFKRQAE